MKTKNQKNNKLRKLLKTTLFLGVIAGATVYGMNDQNSLAQKYKMGMSQFEFSSGKEVSYINLTGERTIEDKKIRLSEGYWTSGRFSF